MGTWEIARGAPLGSREDRQTTLRSAVVRVFIWRQGMVLKHRNSLQKSLYPVVVCPYLRSSETLTVVERNRRQQELWASQLARVAGGVWSWGCPKVFPSINKVPGPQKINKRKKQIPGNINKHTNNTTWSHLGGRFLLHGLQHSSLLINGEVTQRRSHS